MYGVLLLLLLVQVLFKKMVFVRLASSFFFPEISVFIYIYLGYRYFILETYNAFFFFLVENFF